MSANRAVHARLDAEMKSQRLGGAARNVLGITTAMLAVLLAGGWSTLAIAYCEPLEPAARWVLGSVYAASSLATLAALASDRLRRRAMGGFSVLFVTLLVSWWIGVQPSNDRDWQPEVARFAYADIDKPYVTVHNVRNFDYRSEQEFTPHWEDRTYRLDQLVGADLIASYWMGPQIAHIFLSFGFQDGDHLAVSIETRKEKGEEYSTLKGFFRNYELYYVASDERDVIRVRTNFRKAPAEEVYLYPLNVPVERIRRVFLDYLREMNALRKTPEFYNTLTTNCTTGIWLHSRVNPGHLPFSWKMLLSGYIPEYLYKAGRLDTSLPFPELRRRAHINERAEAADDSADFSRLIREGIPKPAALSGRGTGQAG